MAQRKERKTGKSALSRLMSRVRAGKITKADRKTLARHAARARRAR